MKYALRGITAEEISYNMNRIKLDPNKRFEIKPQFTRGVKRVKENDKLYFLTLEVKIEATEENLRSAPDFTVIGPDGSSISLSDYAGKPVVLGFWATWCPACRRELPAFQEAYEAMGDEVTFLMVNITTEESSVDAVAAFLEEQNLSLPVCYDTEGDAMTAYVAYSLPVTYFINADGKIAHQVLGSLNSTTLQEGIDIIIPPV